MKHPEIFSFLSDENEDDFNPDTGEVMLGDIIISVDKVKEQAVEYGHSEKMRVCLSDYTQHASSVRI